MMGMIQSQVLFIGMSKILSCIAHIPHFAIVEATWSVWRHVEKCANNSVESLWKSKRQVRKASLCGSK